MNNKTIFDGRNIYDKEEMEAADYTYYCIGVRTERKHRSNELQLVV